MTKSTINHVALATIHVAHKDPTRYSMNGIHVGPKGFTSTDGTMLVHISHPDGDISSQEPTIIPLKEAKSLVKALGRGKKERPFTLDGTTLSREGEDRSFEPVEGHFPPWEDVIPTDRYANEDIGISPTRMIQLCKAAIAFGGKDCAVRLSVAGPKGALIFKSQSEGQKFIGLLMPLNLANIN